MPRRGSVGKESVDVGQTGSSASDRTEDGKVEGYQPFGVLEDVDLDDSSVGDDERHDRQHAGSGGDDGSGGPVDQRRSDEGSEFRCHHGVCGDVSSRVNHDGPPAARCPAVSPEDDVGIEHGNQCIEVAILGRGEEGVHHDPLPREVRVGSRSLATYPATCSAGELPRGGRAALDQRRDLVEGQGEHVVQHEGEPLGGRQHFQHHHQRESDRIGEQCLVFGIHSGMGADDRFGDAQVERILPSMRPRPQQVQTDPSHHSGKPAAEVLDPGSVCAGQSQPGLERISLRTMLSVIEGGRSSCPNDWERER